MTNLPTFAPEHVRIGGSASIAYILPLALQSLFAELPVPRVRRRKAKATRRAQPSTDGSAL